MANKGTGIPQRSEPPTKKKKDSTSVDVAAGVLRSRYLKQPSHVESDWPKHCVFDYVKLALVEKEDVTLRDDYIDNLIKLRSWSGVDKILKKKEINDLREIFHYKNKPMPRLILVVGGPGIGKTTLANKICIKWARDMFLHEDFNIVVLIALRTVQQRSLEDVMIEQIGQEAYQELIKKLGAKCLIILEGLDEMATERLQSDPLWVKIINLTVFVKAVILITSRPRACQKLKANRRVAILGFGEEEIKSFVEKSFPNDNQIADTFMQQLREYPHIHSLCYVPGSLVMVLDIFKQNLLSTLTKVYQHYIVMMLVREMNRMKLTFSTVTATEIVEQICKILPDIPKEMTGSLFLLSKLAYHSFFERETDGIGKWKKASIKKIIFSEDDLTQCNIEINEHFDGEGLLQVETVYHLSGDYVTYNFIHLAVQELLCAVYMLTLSQEEQYHLLKEYFDVYPNIMIFYCGLTKLDCHQAIYSKLTLPDSAVTAVKCLYEGQWNNDAHTSASPVVLYMGYRTLLPYDILCVSYTYCKYPVTQLNLNACNIRDNGAGILSKWCLNNNEATKLQELNLRGNKLTSEGMKHVMKMVTSSPSLRVLDVSWNGIGDDGVSLCLQHINTLTELMVARCGLSVEGAKYIKVMLMENNKLQYLDIGYNRIGDDGVRLITKGLQCNNTLTELNAWDCGISVIGATYIKEMLMENKKLQCLNIASNKIGDDGVRHITEGLRQNYTLTELMLRNCEISAKGALSISEMIKINHTLQVLDISLNPIGDDFAVTGAKSLAAGLIDNHSIKLLDVRYKDITLDGAVAILEAAVANGVCTQVIIDDEYKSDNKVKELMNSLEERRRREIGSSPDQFSSGGILPIALETLLPSPPQMGQAEISSNMNTPRNSSSDSSSDSEQLTSSDSLYSSSSSPYAEIDDDTNAGLAMLDSVVKTDLNYFKVPDPFVDNGENSDHQKSRKGGPRKHNVELPSSSKTQTKLRYFSKDKNTPKSYMPSSTSKGKKTAASTSKLDKTLPPRKYKRRISCSTCANCLKPDCGKCRNCLDKPKFGGRNTRKQRCIERICMHKEFHDSIQEESVSHSKTGTTGKLPLSRKRRLSQITTPTFDKAADEQPKLTKTPKLSFTPTKLSTSTTVVSSAASKVTMTTLEKKEYLMQTSHGDANTPKVEEKTESQFLLSTAPHTLRNQLALPTKVANKEVDSLCKNSLPVQAETPSSRKSLGGSTLATTAKPSNKTNSTSTTVSTMVSATTSITATTAQSSSKEVSSKDTPSKDTPSRPSTRRKEEATGILEVGESSTTRLSDNFPSNIPADSTVNTIPLLGEMPMEQWTIVDVTKFLDEIKYQQYTSIFQHQEIDGQVLVLLEVRDMVQTLNMKLYPALKLHRIISSLKQKLKQQDDN